jgi:nitrite reductase (NADH) large subunit
MSGDTTILRTSFDDVSGSATAVAPDPVGGSVALGLDRLNRARREKGPAPGPHDSVRRLAETTYVCRCQSVTKGAIVAAIRAGHCDVEALGQSIGAGTGCGSCQAGLRKLLLAYSVESVPGSRAQPPVAALATPPNQVHKPLLAVSVVALLMVLLIALVRPLPFSDTVRGGWQLDVLWRSRLGKQVSGYTMLGLSLSALAVSLRKRWRRFTFGRFAVWRLAHAVVGTVTLGVLMIHTGLRLGGNLNQMLMVGFLVFAGLGAVAGGLTALKPRLGLDIGHRLCTWFTRIHVLLLGPVLVLIGFHVLKVHYY